MDKSITLKLPTPIPKPHGSLKRPYPFPIIRSDCNENRADPIWNCMVGYLENGYVLVHDEDSIKILFNQGCFGKGTLSKSTPQICFKNKNKKKRKGRNKRSKQNVTPTEDLDSDVIQVDDDDIPKPCSSKEEEIHVDDDDISKPSSSKEEEIQVDDDDIPKPSSSKEEEIQVDDDEFPQPPCKKEKIEVVISDSDSSSSDIEVVSTVKQARAAKDSSQEKESLQLTFEEAYFLSYGLGCLIVKDNKDQPIDLSRLWSKFCDISPEKNFPVLYTAYHHFRSKGWIVKPGVKYGVDYLLYKDGPAYHHATYSVIVQAIKEKHFKDMKSNRHMTWTNLMALNRLNNSTGKTLMFLYVIKPSFVSENKISTPFCISQYKVEEVLFQRWVASENRDGND